VRTILLRRSLYRGKRGSVYWEALGTRRDLEEKKKRFPMERDLCDYLYSLKEEKRGSWENRKSILTLEEAGKLKSPN